jgi:hypothetical protein
MFRTPEIERETALDVATSTNSLEPSLGEYLGAKFSRGLDYTLPRMRGDELRTAKAEREAYGEVYTPGKGWDLRPEGRFLLDPLRTRAAREEQEPLYPDRIVPEESWKQSEWYRPGIAYTRQMTPVRARILAEEYDRRRARDQVIQRSPAGLRSVLGFGAELLGNLPDPVNLLPLGVAGKGTTLAARMGWSALEGMAGAAVSDALILPDLARRGEDVGWEDAANDILFGALLGGAAGGVGHALERRRARQRATLPERTTAGRALDKAVGDLAERRPVDVRPVLDTPEGARLLEEMRAVGRVYDDALFAPLNPSANNEAVLRSALAEALDPAWAEIVVDKGAGRLDKGRIKRDLEYGLAKIIYEHGEAAPVAGSKAVTRADLLDFPHVVREFLPVERTMKRGGANWTWVVRGENGHKVIHVARMFTGSDGRPHLLTSHVANEGSPYPFSKKAWPKEKAALLASRETSRVGLADTVTGASTRPHGDVLSRGASGATEGNIGQANREVNWDTAEEPVLAGRSVREASEESALLDERRQTEVDGLEGRGELRTDELEELREAREAVERTERYEDAGLSLVECVLKEAE